VLAFADVVHLLANELAGLSARRFAFARSMVFFSGMTISSFGSGKSRRFR
jgi:hypothetical protein